MTPSRYRRAAPPFLILFALAAYCGTRPHNPAVSSVNGSYKNSCCNDLVLRDGLMITENDRVPFQLERMKFGLTAYPTRLPIVRNERIEFLNDGDAGGLIFSENGTILTLNDARFGKRKYVFKRL
jgi:alpha-D-ribose 1-methylphosphonate 5-triphosphate synthase subunit PhnI